jgi:hypothetical protein
MIAKGHKFISQLLVTEQDITIVLQHLRHRVALCIPTLALSVRRLSATSSTHFEGSFIIYLTLHVSA